MTSECRTISLIKLELLETSERVWSPGVLDAHWSHRCKGNWSTNTDQRDSYLLKCLFSDRQLNSLSVECIRTIYRQRHECRNNLDMINSSQTTEARTVMITQIYFWRCKYIVRRESHFTEHSLYFRNLCRNVLKLIYFSTKDRQFE